MEYAEIFVLFIISSLYFLMVLLTCRLLWLCKKYVGEDPMENGCIEKDFKPSINTSDKALSLALANNSSSSGFSTENSRINMNVEQVKGCECQTSNAYNSLKNISTYKKVSLNKI